MASEDSEETPFKAPLSGSLPGDRFRTQWIILGSVLSILGAVSLYYLLHQHNTIEENQRERLQAQAVIVEQNLGTQLESTNSALEGVLKDLPALRDRAGVRIANRRLKALSDAMPGVRTMLIVDDNGSVVASSRDELLGKEAGHRDYYLTPRQRPDPTQLYVSPPFKTLLGAYVINLTRAITGPGGEFKGVVTASLDPDFFSILMSSVLYAPDMCSGITHYDGLRILLVPERPGQSGRDVADSHTFFSRHLTGGAQHSILTGVCFSTGEMSLTALRTINPADLHMDKPLVISVTRQLQSLYAGWRRDAMVQGAIFVVFALAAVTGLFLFQRRQKFFDRQSEDANKALEDSARRYQSLLKSATDGIHIIDLKGKVVEANQAFLTMLGYTEEQACGLNISDWNVQWDAEELTQRLKDVVAAPVTFETRHRRRDGEVIDVEISARGVNFDGEDFVYASSRDITGRKRAEKELRDSRQQMMNIIDFLPDATFVIDLEGRVIAWNKAMEEMSGVDKEDMIGQGDHAYTIPFYGDRRPQLLDLLDGTDPEPATGYRHLQRQGEALYAEAFAPAVYGGKGAHIWTVGAPLYDSQGKRVGAIESIRNITERKRAEDELQQAKEAAEASTRSKSAFLANMSHEIRTPMNAILGLTRLTLETVLTDKQQDFLLKVQSSSRALLNLLNDILDYSKIEAGRLELEETDFELDGVFNSLSDLFSHPAEQKGAEIFYEVMPDVPMMLKGDPLRLGQILSNLIGNAIKFTSEGEIHVKVECLESSGEDILLRFLVRDTGIGIEPEQCEMLFQAFGQVDSSISRKYGGSGLGLTICKSLVKLMGGEIRVESEPGKGSTFSFTARFLSDADPLLRDPRALKGMRALVVDDQELSRIILQRILESWSFEVATASCGAEAFDLILQGSKTQRPFELILLDWKMPGLDGLEVARLVQREIARGALEGSPTVIMVSASDREQLLRCAEGTHLDDVLIKPVTSSSLFDSVMYIQNQKARQLPRHALEIRAHLNENLSGVRGARILLVEDNAINQLIARNSLEKMGFVVEVANNGSESVAMASEKSYDAILMDLQMPGVDGFEATRLIRATETGKTVPIIALTAAAMIEEKKACLDAGMNGHVPKPIDLAELADALIACIEPGHRAAPPKAVSAEPEHRDVPGSAMALDGFDLDSASQRLHGNQSLLANLLHVFAEHLETLPEELGALLEAGEFGKAAAQVHGIKGLAGNLGAVELFAAATTLEQELSAGHASSRPHFEGMVNKASQSIRGSIVLGQAEITATVELDRAQAAAFLGRLRGLNQSCTLVPSELQQQLKAMLRGHVPESMLTTVLRQLNEFEHENAATTVARIASQLGIVLEG